MFRPIKQVFIALLSISGSLASIFDTSHHIKYISLNNQQYMTQPSLINLHPNVYIKGLRCYPFAVNLDRCMESCNTLIGLSNTVCDPNKMQNLNFNVFRMMTRINELKILTKHIIS